MSTVLKKPHKRSRPVVPEEQRLVLYDVDWKTYVRLGNLFKDRHLRFTYDQGVLEIMTLSFRHEKGALLVGRFVETLTEEFNLPISGGKSTTFKRRKKQKGLEPDECYWIQNEPAIHGKEEINLRIDPPPDIAVEIDISSSVLDRLGIYAALKVPEIWQYDGQAVCFYLLQAHGSYMESATSRAFPRLQSSDITRFLQLRFTHDDNALIREFRAWIRQSLSKQS